MNTVLILGLIIITILVYRNQTTIIGNQLKILNKRVSIEDIDGIRVEKKAEKEATKVINRAKMVSRIIQDEDN